jgi:riboflavin-specific deaminase-like protein
MRSLLPFVPLTAADELDDDALGAMYAVADRTVPHLRVNFVTSLDGAVTLHGYSEGLSGPADKRVFALLRDDCDALLVGAGTLRHEGYRGLALPLRREQKRRAAGLAPQPTLVIVSGQLGLPADHPAFTESPVRPIVLTRAAAPAEQQKALAEVADVLVCGDQEVDVRAGVAALAARGLPQVLCEGGPHLLGALTAADAIDELCLTVAPMLAGPGAGRITEGRPLPDPVRLRLAHVLEGGGNLILRYLVDAARSPTGSA